MAWGVLGAALQPVLSVASSIPAIRYRPVPCTLPFAVAPHPSSTRDEVDAALSQLDPKGWAHTPVLRRIALLNSCLRNLVDAAPEVARLSVQSKGSYGTGLGEELLALVPSVLGLKEYVLTLEWVAKGKRRPVRTRQVPGTDHVAAEVFPWGMFMAMLPGSRCEVWMAPGKPADAMAVLYDKKAKGQLGDGGVAAVLGAGNQVSVVLMDIFHKLVADDEVVCVKMSPVNENVGPVFERALSPLVEANALRFIYGGREVGEQLVSHPRVTSVHLTGSGDTCNAIVWGSPAAPRTGAPRLQKAITAELGNVTPIIIVPGAWSEQDMRLHCQGVVSALVHNASHNCLAAELVVTDAAWPQRQQFLDELRRQLGSTPQRCAYYPGSQAKRDAFVKHMQARNKRVLELGTPVAARPSSVGSSSPWLLVEGLTPDEAQTRLENWGGMLQEVVLDSSSGMSAAAAGAGAAPASAGCDPARFLQLAEEFVNQRVWGSLCAAVWVHPDTEAQLGEKFEVFLSRLRYGCITVNAPCVVGFGFPSVPWGAAPGNTLEDVESGIGFVHNTWLFEHAHKGVVRMPWRPVPKPMYLADNLAAEHLGMPLLHLLARLDAPVLAMPSMLAVAASAVRG